MYRVNLARVWRSNLESSFELQGRMPVNELDLSADATLDNVLRGLLVHLPAARVECGTPRRRIAQQMNIVTDLTFRRASVCTGRHRPNLMPGSRQEARLVPNQPGRPARQVNVVLY